MWRGLYNRTEDYFAQELRPRADKWDLIKLKTKQSSEEAHRVGENLFQMHI